MVKWGFLPLKILELTFKTLKLSHVLGIKGRLHNLYSHSSIIANSNTVEESHDVTLSKLGYELMKRT